MKLKIILFFVLSLVLAVLVAPFIQSLFESQYASYSIASIGTPPLEGFFLGYILFSSVLISLVARNLKAGFVVALPIVLLAFFRAVFDLFFWLSLLLLALGLGLAWVIPLIKNRLSKP